MGKPVAHDSTAKNFCGKACWQKLVNWGSLTPQHHIRVNRHSDIWFDQGSA